MHIQAPILCSFSGNDNISSNSSRSNSDFELVASSPHSMYNSGSSSSNEEVQFSSKNMNNGNNSECIQFMQIMDSNSNQDQPPNPQLLARENENLKKQLEWMKIGLTKKNQEKERLEQELNQNRSVMARILACQIDGKRKEREAAAHASATATIINFEPIRDIWEELSSDSSLPPTSQILTNFHQSMRRQDNSPQPENLNSDIWREPDDIDNDEENPNQLPLLDIWQEPEEGDENGEGDLETETGGEIVNDIWAEEEESNGDQILIQLDFEQNGDNANEEIVQEELIQQAQNIMPLITDEQEMANAQLLDQIEQQQINDDPTDQNTISTLYDVYESALESLNVSRSASPIPTSSGTNSNLFSFASDPIRHSSLVSAPSLISSIPMTQNSNERQLLPANATVENVIQEHFHPSEPSANEQREEDPIASLAFQELRRDILDIRNAMGNKIEDIERRMHQCEERFVNFQIEELVRTFNTRMDQIETRIRSMDYLALTEEFRNDQSLENVDFDRRLANLEQKLQRIEECPPFKKSFLLEYANTLGEINLNQELIIRNSFTYSDDFKQLLFSGASIGLNGIVVNASTKIQDYPARFLDIVIQNAINSRNSEALIPFFVINFVDNKAKWPSTLNQIDKQNNIFDLQTTSQNAQLMHSTVHNQGIKKRAICADKIIYSFRNLNSKAKFVMEVFFHSQEEIYKKTGAFTIRCLN